MKTVVMTAMQVTPFPAAIMKMPLGNEKKTTGVATTNVVKTKVVGKMNVAVMKIGDPKVQTSLLTGVRVGRVTPPTKSPCQL